MWTLFCIIVIGLATVSEGKTRASCYQPMYEDLLQGKRVYFVFSGWEYNITSSACQSVLAAGYPRPSWNWYLNREECEALCLRRPRVTVATTTSTPAPTTSTPIYTTPPSETIVFCGNRNETCPDDMCREEGHCTLNPDASCVTKVTCDGGCHTEWWLKGRQVKCHKRLCPARVAPIFCYYFWHGMWTPLTCTSDNDCPGEEVCCEVCSNVKKRCAPGYPQARERSTSTAAPETSEEIEAVQTSRFDDDAKNTRSNGTMVSENDAPENFQFRNSSDDSMERFESTQFQQGVNMTLAGRDDDAHNLEDQSERSDSDGSHKEAR